MYEVSERYLAFGQNSFIKEVVIPAGEKIEKLAKEYPCTDEIQVKVQSRPTAFLSGLEALIGVSVFLGTWAGTKFLDEIYDAKIGPAIKEYLGQYIEKSGKNKKYSLSIAAHKRGVDSSVLICCVGSSIEEIEASEVHIPAVLRVAEGFIDSDRRGAIYLFLVDSGRCNLEPSVYDSYEAALDGLKRMYPAKLPTNVARPRD